jgi:hypothetical protein
MTDDRPNSFGCPFLDRGSDGRISGNRKIESVTASRDCDDDLAPGLRPRQPFAQQKNALRQVALFDDYISPNRTHQLLFSQEPLGVPDHVKKQIEGA